MTLMVLNHKTLSPKSSHLLDFPNIIKISSIHCDSEESHIVIAAQHSNRSIHNILE
jgi:hypothetical protein